MQELERRIRMMYTIQELGKDLKRWLSPPYYYDPDMFARFADFIYYITPRSEMSQEACDVLDALSMMRFGQEFIFTEQQLLLLADKLMNNEKDALQKVHDKILGAVELEKLQDYRDSHMYSDQRLGKELKEFISQQEEYDPYYVARWADHVRYENNIKTSREARSILDTLSAMSCAPEMEWTKEELLLLADKLINNEKDAEQQMRDNARRLQS